MPLESFKHSGTILFNPFNPSSPSTLNFSFNNNFSISIKPSSINNFFIELPNYPFSSLINQKIISINLDFHSPIKTYILLLANHSIFKFILYTHTNSSQAWIEITPSHKKSKSIISTQLLNILSSDSVEQSILPKSQSGILYIHSDYPSHELITPQTPYPPITPITPITPPPRPITPAPITSECKSTLNPQAKPFFPKSTLNPQAKPFFPKSTLNPQAKPFFPKSTLNPQAKPFFPKRKGYIIKRVL